MNLVVLGDSTAFTDNEGPKLPDAEHLYPQVLRRRLEERLDGPVDLSVLARPGNSVREVWRTLTKDRHVQFEVLARADAVVIAVGSFDHVPAGVPEPVEAVVPYIRPAGLRRSMRRLIHDLSPGLIRLRGGARPRTPRGDFARLYDAILLQVRGLARGAAGVVLAPTSHRAARYAGIDRPWAEGDRVQRRIAAEHGFPIVGAWPVVERHLAELNVDGIHWPPAAHEQIGLALAGELEEQLRGRRPRPLPIT